MKRSFLVQTVAFFLLAVLLLSSTGIQTAQAQAVYQADLTLYDLGMVSPQTLSSPVSEVVLHFNLPTDWVPQGIVSLDVELSAFFSSLVAAESGSTVSGLVGGDFSVFLNDTLVGVTTLQESGLQTVHFEFDPGLFLTAKRDTVNILRLRWDGSISCQSNLLSSVNVSPASKIGFWYEKSTAALSLNDFPVPFMIENAIYPVPLKIVLPSTPTAGELKAAMIIATGIGQIAGENTSVELITLSELNPSESQLQNIILVATNDTLTTVSPSSLGIQDGLQTGDGDGVLNIFQQKGGVGLLVSGDEAGIVKAAQAVSADQVIATGDERTMYISNVNPVADSTGLEDMTLEDMGVGEMVFTQPNETSQSFNFFVPAGNQVRADASFSLILSHSQQLDYLRSGLQMKVNGYPAVSLRLTDTTSNEALFTLILPSNLIHVGRNTIEFEADIYTRDLCTPATANIAWLRVSSNSLLHLPLESAIGGSMLPKNFTDFPDSFLAGSGLNNVVLEVSPGDFANIQAAAKLAIALGSAMPDHNLIQMAALFSNDPEAADTGDKSVILVGKPSDFPMLTQQFPSLVFNEDNTLSETSVLELVTKPETGADTGYLAVRGFDAATSKVLLAVLGNTSKGVGLAVDALTSQMAGENNFLVVVGADEQIGWMDTGIATGKIVSPVAESTEVVQTSDPVQVFRIGMLKWVVPALVVLLALTVFFLYLEIRQSIRKTK